MTRCTAAQPDSVPQLRLQCLPTRADQGQLLQESIANSSTPRKQKKRRHAQNEAASTPSDADPAFNVKPQDGQLPAHPAPANGGLQPQLAAAGQVQVHGVAHQITRAEMDEVCRTEGGIGRQSELLIEGLAGKLQDCSAALDAGFAASAGGIHSAVCLRSHHKLPCSTTVQLLSVGHAADSVTDRNSTHPAVQTETSLSRSWPVCCMADSVLLVWLC